MDRELAVNAARRHPALAALLVIVAGEVLLLGAATVWLVIELVVDTPESAGTAIALAVTTAVLAAGLAWLGLGAANGSRTVRGGLVVWQVLQAAVGFGALQGVYARPEVGWALVLPAVAAFVLLLTPPVTAALGRGPDDDEDPAG